MINKKSIQPHNEKESGAQKNMFHSLNRAGATPEECANFLNCGYDEAVKALEKEDPVALAVATEYIQYYSDKAGELLKRGNDYLTLLTPTAATPALERIAMEVVLDALEAELDEEDM